jgi:hypothetical protein
MVATINFILNINTLIYHLINITIRNTIKQITILSWHSWALLLVSMATAFYPPELNEVYKDRTSSKGGSHQPWMRRIRDQAMGILQSIGGRLQASIESLKTKPRRASSTTLPRRRHPTQSKAIRACVALLVAMTAGHQERYIVEGGPFDTDSHLVGVDNRCSACISHVREDFPGGLKTCNRVIKGYGGVRHFQLWTGTLVWTWDDDEGKSHTFNIPNSYYIPEGKIRLLSPQHWAQQCKGKDKWGGAGETTTAIRTTLFWNGSESKRTIPIDRDGDNVATFRLTPGYKAFHTYCTDIGDQPTPDSEGDPLTVLDLQAIDPNYITDDEEEEDIADRDPSSGWPSESSGSSTGSSVNRPDPDPATASKCNQAEQTIDSEGVPMDRLASCNVPICSACQYCKATKRKWRPKTSKNHAPNKPTQPGQVILVDQMVSPTPGLIAQMTGFLTMER